jgi:catechol 2,3-dioxygenase-like lactoylglutathione lyase family enzyme
MARVRRLSLVTVLVPDYDEAIGYYVGVLGFALVHDDDLGRGKRWVVVSPDSPPSTGLLLARAANPDQRARVGDQVGGRVAFFLETNDFEQEYARLLSAGVQVAEAPRREAYGQVVVFADRYGNRWDLIEPS